MITAAENTNLEDRNATIELRCDKDVRTIVVVQKQKNALSLTTAKFEVSEEGGVIELEIKSNVDFSYKISDECTDGHPLSCLCAPDGDRTRTPITGQGILSPSCLPIPTPEQSIAKLRQIL